MKNAIEELVEARDLIKRNLDVSLLTAAMTAVISNGWIATPDLDQDDGPFKTYWVHRHATTFAIIWNDGRITGY